MAPALVLALLAAQLGGKTFAIDPQQSTVKFHVSHKLHQVDGRAGTVEARAAVAEDGRAMVMVRIPATSLDSGDANRDANLRDVVEAAKYPFIVFKGVSTLPSGGVTPGKPFDLNFQGELELHGMKRSLDLPVRAELGTDGTLKVRGTTRISLDAYRIERPSLLLVKVEDDCRVDLDVLMREVAAK